MALPSISNKKRAVVIVGVIALVFVFLVGKLVSLMFVQGQWLQEKAEDNWTKDLYVSAKRGSFLDRNGNVLAMSANADTVVLRPKEIAAADKELKEGEQKTAVTVAQKLAPILEMEESEIQKKAEDTSKSEVWLKRQISSEQSDAIQALDLPGVYFTIDVKRYYPNKDFLTQVLGFTSVDGEGLEGLEKKYDKYLSGQAGRIVSQSDARGRILESGGEVYVEPQDGYDVVLTIDEVIQSYLEKALEEALIANEAKSVQGIVMDPNTGEILAMSCLPDADLNDLPRDDIETLQEVTRNKLVVDAYEPGSTFKVITTAAALDSGTVTTDTTFNCPGYRMVDGEKIKCWRTGRPHGTQKLEQAVQNSCNPCFMDMALDMGVDTFYEYIYNFGFGQNTGIDYSADGAGIVRHKKYVKNVDLARIGFGQSIAVTPLQLISAISATVNGGTLYQPKLVKEFQDSEGNTVETFEPVAVRQVISEETSATMRQILESVVSQGGGGNAKIEGYKVGGKTGTAQKYDENGQILQNKHISSFIGFAPADDPQYIVLIIIDEAGVAVDYGGVIAAPYAKDVLQECLEYGNIPPTEPVKTDEEGNPVEVEQVEVPDLSGVTLEDAKARLEKLGLTYTADGEGLVDTQLPEAGTMLDKGESVALGMTQKYGVDIATPMVEVPDLSGKTIMEAMELLRENGLNIQIEGNGTVYEQSPVAGQQVERDSTVTVKLKEKEDTEG